MTKTKLSLIVGAALLAVPVMVGIYIGYNIEKIAKIEKEGFYLEKDDENKLKKK